MGKTFTEIWKHFILDLCIREQHLPQNLSIIKTKNIFSRELWLLTFCPMHDFSVPYKHKFNLCVCRDPPSTDGNKQNKCVEEVYQERPRGIDYKPLCLPYEKTSKVVISPYPPIPCPTHIKVLTYQKLVLSFKSITIT